MFNHWFGKNGGAGRHTAAKVAAFFSQRGRGKSQSFIVFAAHFSKDRHPMQSLNQS